ncbi:unnamed protein product [Didymodactylos carnosus]|uniref:Uncharacterized protein n=3 Tax=Didymodactylos carnosus TaxID=1234261 RepID=A0A813S7L3_9BILA|nr:unnamed protein product [Didymodactylos carnosus]CAF3579826.1 unnamed protein product [Didymodactylos carnosus]
MEVPRRRGSQRMITVDDLPHSAVPSSSSQLVPLADNRYSTLLPPIGSQSLPDQSFRFRPGNQQIPFDESINQSLYKIKQLESRLQVTEISNRTLLEEVIRLQTELFTAVRRSQDILQEERLSRQQIENNVRIQNDVILQLTSRIKRNEDTFNDEHQSYQIINSNVKGLEQNIMSIQKEYLLRRDTYTYSVEGLRKQIDDLNQQRENLEKIQLNMIEDIRSMRNRMDMDSVSVQSFSQELRQKTRKLDEDTRTMENLLRKQQETINAGDLLFNSFRNATEMKLNEFRDAIGETRNRIDFDREDRRLVETQLASKVNDVQSSLNITRSTQADALKTVENIRREITNQNEQIQTKLRQEMNDIASQIMLRTTDKLERLKDDIDYKSKEYEKVELENQLDMLKVTINDEQARTNNEMRETMRKSAETLRKLNDGIILIEQQADENRRKIEKVLDAEIKSRKLQTKEISETLTKNDEKFSYQVGNIQSSLTAVNQRLAEMRDLSNKPEIINLNRRLELSENAHRDSELHLRTLSGRIDEMTVKQTNVETKLRNTDEKLKDDEAFVRDLSSKFSMLPTVDDLTNVKHDISEKHHEETLLQSIAKNEQRVNGVRVDLNVLEEQLNQKMNSIADILESEQLLQSQMREKHSDQDLWKREVDQKLSRLTTMRDTLPQEIFNLSEKLSYTRKECMKFSQDEDFKTKDEIEKVRKELAQVQRLVAKDTAKPVTQQEIDYQQPPDEPNEPNEPDE